MQVYIFIRLQSQDTDGTSQNESFSINEFDLTQSILIGVINLGYNLYQYNKSAKFHGLSWYEYALKMLQLSQIPLNRFVPRTPAIKQGIISNVNWSNFKLDNESLVPIVQSINSTKSKLNQVKISLLSISNSKNKLNDESCRLFGEMIVNKNLKLHIIEASDVTFIKNKFYQIDKEKKGCFTLNEFISNIKRIDSYYETLDDKEITNVFSNLAIRNVNSDHVYLYDFLNSILSFDKYNYGVEFLEIWLPIHFIFDKLGQMCQKLATIIDTHDCIYRNNDVIINDVTVIKFENIWDNKLIVAFALFMFNHLFGDLEFRGRFVGSLFKSRENSKFNNLNVLRWIAMNTGTSIINDDPNGNANLWVLVTLFDIWLELILIIFQIN